MATFNQSPTSQGSTQITLGLSDLFTSGTVTSVTVNTFFADPVSISYQAQPGGSTLNLQLGSGSSGGSQTLPTTGQIWPAGFN